MEQQGYSLEQLLQQGAKLVQQNVGGFTEEQLKQQGAIEKQSAFNYMTGKKEETPEGSQFLERLKLSFTDPDKIKELEQRIGTRGKTEIGDMADLVGGIPTLAGSILGGIGGGVAGGIGAVPGAAIGAAAGESIRHSIGNIWESFSKPLSQEEQTKRVIDQVKDPILTGLFTYLGGKVFEKLISPIGRWTVKRLPEKLYGGKLFTQTSDDIIDLVKSEKLIDLKNANPTLFNEYLKNEIIHIKNGIPELNKTLARELLEEGLKGNP